MASRPLWLSGFVCGLAIFASSASAEENKGPAGKGRGGREEVMKKVLEKFDADGDGKLSDDEKAKAKAAFAGRAGKPGAGKPGANRPGPGGRKPGGEQAAAMREKILGKFDKDGDGKLSDAERAAAKEAFAARKKPE